MLTKSSNRFVMNGSVKRQKMDGEKRVTSREDYKNYLRKTGVWDTLNDFLVKLYETKDKVDNLSKISILRMIS